MDSDEQLRDFDRLIDQSSLGASGGRSLRSRVSDETVARVLRRVEELPDGLDPLHDLS